MDRDGISLAFSINNGNTTRTDFTDHLHETFGFRTDYQILNSKQMKKILKLQKSRSHCSHSIGRNLTNINLAAQAGLRYSLENLDAYMQRNGISFFNRLEACRHYPVDHLVYPRFSKRMTIK